MPYCGYVLEVIIRGVQPHLVNKEAQMLENTHAWFFPLCYFSVMIGVVVINHVTTHVRTEKRFALEEFGFMEH